MAEKIDVYICTPHNKSKFMEVLKLHYENPAEILYIFADDSKPGITLSDFKDDFDLNQAIYSFCYATDAKEAEEVFKQLLHEPDVVTMWYWCVKNKDTLCSGCFDEDDFEEHIREQLNEA